MSDRSRQTTLSLIVVIFALCAPCATSPENGSPYIVAIFAGHITSSNGGSSHHGARSASGKHEYVFNDAMVSLFEKMGDHTVSYKVFPASLKIPLRDRPTLAKQTDASILVEIHHDSVQPHIYQQLIKAKQGDPLLVRYRGFSIHVYPSDQSVRLAKAIEFQLLSHSLPYAEYHTEDIPGERMELVEETKAVYKRENLVILRNSSIPTIIIECGCIANPQEERLLNNPRYRQIMVSAIHKGILSFLCGGKSIGDDSRKTLQKHTEWQALQELYDSPVP